MKEKKTDSPTAPATGRPREFDADAALDRAMHVFWRRGYLGASLSDLTEAMGINRPSLYAAFGNKETLFRKALQRYMDGPGSYVRAALDEPTSRAVVARILRGTVNSGTDPKNPPGCMYVHGALSCGDPDDPVRKELCAGKDASETALRKRFKRAVDEGDLPADADTAALARYIVTLNCGFAVQAAMGASRKDLLRVVETVLKSWPAR